MSEKAVLWIRPVRRADQEAWVRMRCAHWPDGAEDHAPEIGAFFDGTAQEPQAVFVAENNDSCVAFMELSIRQNLPGHVGQKVGYVEGLFVESEFRGGTLVKRFLRTAQAWAREKNCTAFASDRAERIIFDPRYKLSV